MITILAACGALMATGVPAQAAAKDPVSVLKTKLKPGHGVRFTETTTWSDGTDEREAQSNKGVFQFGKKGIAAFDIKTDAVGYGPGRVINIGKTTYHSGDVLTRLLSEDKPWFKTPTSGLPDSWGQILNPAEPETLAALIKNGKTDKSSVTGEITMKDLKKASAWVSDARMDSDFDSTKISYTLTLSSAGLVSKVRSSYTVTEDGESSIVTVDSRYTGWGGKVSVKAPDPGKVTTKLFG
ncbi:hypothetical protein ITP53_38460 [Nonomuraea sp. K274]|uniref:Lipoprotein n=1 Tax=Nonomuraea cypriaca TaxID=1187855 RepID=A0A931F2F2_9ACTN|nr:hypothetical protein [Nonomuraea cypriaca]MBF8191480.1 hypothetical protein [Nonomuraea cypriaca]